jgi:hypothetical protein
MGFREIRAVTKSNCISIHYQAKRQPVSTVLMRGTKLRCRLHLQRGGAPWAPWRHWFILPCSPKLSPTRDSTRRVAGHTDLVSAATAEGADALYLVSLNLSLGHDSQGEDGGLPIWGGWFNKVQYIIRHAADNETLDVLGESFDRPRWALDIHHEGSEGTMVTMSSLTILLS